MKQFRHFCWFLFYLLEISHERELWATPVFELKASELTKDKLQSNSSQVQVTDISETLKKSTFSKLGNITELRIIRNQIRDIEPRALCSVSGLKILELDLNGNKNPPMLKKEMFHDCNIEELILKFDYNNPSRIETDALVNIPNLKYLSIDSLRIDTLDKDFLKLKSNYLIGLTLSNIHCSEIDTNFLDDFSNLETLEIVHVPELTRLPNNLFKNTPKIKKLSFKDDAVKNLSWNEFRGLSSLKELDISDNQIDSFDVDRIVKNMPRLEKLALDFNPITCTDVKSVVRQLESQLKRSVRVPTMYFYGDC